MRYTVNTVIQGASIDAGEPVEVQWYGGPNLAHALAAMAQAAVLDSERPDDMPESARYRTLKIVLNMEVTP